MNLSAFLVLAGCFCLTFSSMAETNQPIPCAEVGANATAQYSGHGLDIIPTPRGARLRCIFQKLEGEITAEGLSVASTLPGASGRVQLTAERVSRENGQVLPLKQTGRVESGDGQVRWVRPGLIEEYSVSVDGIRQDYMLTEPTAGTGPIRIELAVRGACAESSSDAVRLVLNESNRELNYNRLRVTDARGRVLAARMQVLSATRLVLAVEDGRSGLPGAHRPNLQRRQLVQHGRAQRGG
jgi:hypothetical protein